jgi:hypothetical protein
MNKTKTIVKCLITVPVAILWLCITPMLIILDFCWALGDWLKSKEERTLFTLFKNVFLDDIKDIPSPVKLWKE